MPPFNPEFIKEVMVTLAAKKFASAVFSQVLTLHAFFISNTDNPGEVMVELLSVFPKFDVNPRFDNPIAVSALVVTTVSTISTVSAVTDVVSVERVTWARRRRADMASTFASVPRWHRLPEKKSFFYSQARR